MPGLLYFTHGLPLSGKTTWAKEKAASNPERIIRVNPDEIKQQVIDEQIVTKRSELGKAVRKRVTETIQENLNQGKMVILDGVNLNKKSVSQMVRLGRECGADIRGKYFNVPLDEINKRIEESGQRISPGKINDYWRMWGNHEGSALKEFIYGRDGSVRYARDTSDPVERVIENYNATLSKAPQNNAGGKQHAICFDMDGTLADTREIGDKWMSGERGNFHMFHKSSEFIPANEDVADIAKQAAAEGFSVIVVTARASDYAPETINWLKNNEIPVEKLYMRTSGDYRPDYDVKTDIIQQIADDGYDIVHSVDDNPQVLRRWGELGVRVTKVPFHTPVKVAEGEEPPVYGKQVVPSPLNSGKCLRCGKPLKNGNIGPKCKSRG